MTYCYHALSVHRPLNNLHFPFLLQKRLVDFDETWYGQTTQGPLQVLLFFGQIRQGAGPKKGHRVPFFQKFFFRPERYSNKPNA